MLLRDISTGLCSVYVDLGGYKEHYVIKYIIKLPTWQGSLYIIFGQDFNN